MAQCTHLEEHGDVALQAGQVSEFAAYNTDNHYVRWCIMPQMLWPAKQEGL